MRKWSSPGSEERGAKCRTHCAPKKECRGRVTLQKRGGSINRDRHGIEPREYVVLGNGVWAGERRPGQTGGVLERTRTTLMVVDEGSWKQEGWRKVSKMRKYVSLACTDFAIPS